MDTMPTLDRGDWVRARDGSPELIIVDRVEDYRGQSCVVDPGGSGLYVKEIAEVRKADGTCWCRPDDVSGGDRSAGPDDV